MFAFTSNELSKRILSSVAVTRFLCLSQYEKNSVVWVRERTTPTEPKPFVGEVFANFYGQRVPHGQRDGSLRP
jgi:hypothetical protein